MFAGPRSVFRRLVTSHIVRAAVAASTLSVPALANIVDYFPARALDLMAKPPVKLVRVMCNAKAGVLRLEYVAFGDAGLSARPTETERFARYGRPKPRFNWEAYGLHQPGYLSSQCKLPDAKYVLTTRWEPVGVTGHCAGKQGIVLRLQRNDSGILDQLAFGPDCAGNDTVRTITVRSGHAGATSSLCMTAPGSTEERCETIGEAANAPAPYSF